MRVERRNLMFVLSDFLIDAVACSNLKVFEGVHVIQVDVSIKVVVSKFSEVNLADKVFNIGPFEGISGLRSRKHCCDTVNSSHFFFFILIIK